MKYVEGATQGPREDELTVAGNSSIGSNTVWALEHPVLNIFSALRPKEPEADAVQSFVDTHVTCSWGGVVS